MPGPGIPQLNNAPEFRDEAVSVLIKFSESTIKLQTLDMTFYLPGGMEFGILAQSYTPKPPAVGFGTQSYHLENQDGCHRFEPVTGEQLLDPEKARDCPPGYRFQELTDRLSRGPIEFRWVVERDANGKVDNVKIGVLSILNQKTAISKA